MAKLIAEIVTCLLGLPTWKFQNRQSEAKGTGGKSPNSKKKVGQSVQRQI